MMDICIVGIGNELREDDGVGLVVVAALQNGAFHGKVDLFNLGLDLFRLPGLQRQYHFIFIIDALPPGSEPGRVTVTHWTKQLSERENLFSLHDLDLLWQLQIELNRTQECVSEIWLIGIQTASMEWNTNLSAEINAKLPFILEDIKSKIESILNIN